MNEIIAALVGVVLGFLLSEFREWRREGLQANKVHQLLSLELDHNVQIINEMRASLLDKENEILEKNRKNSGVGDADQDANLSSIIAQQLASHLGYLPGPVWHRNVWDTQLHALSRVLNQEQINNIHGFYTRLDQLSDICLRLTNIQWEFATQAKPVSSGSVGSFIQPGYTYVREKITYWNLAKGLIEEIFESGNPIK